MSIDVVEVVIWRESSVSGGSGAVQMFLRWQQHLDCSANVCEMAATETITSIILIKLIRVSLGTVRHPRRFKIVVIDIQITLKQMLRDFIGIRVNRAKKSGMVNITSSVNSRERSGINTILHELNPLFT